MWLLVTATSSTILGIIHVDSSNGESCTPQFMTALGSIAKNYNHGPLSQANQMLVDKSSLALQDFLLSCRTQKWVTLQKYKGLVHL